MIYACAGYRYLERFLASKTENTKRFNFHMAREEFDKSTLPEANSDCFHILLDSETRKNLPPGFKCTSEEMEVRVTKALEHLRQFLPPVWQE